MTSVELAAWYSAVMAVLSVAVALLALSHSKRVATRVTKIESSLESLSQSATHRPVISTGGGGGGGAGSAGGDGGSVVYNRSQSGSQG